MVDDGKPSCQLVVWSGKPSEFHQLTVTTGRGYSVLPFLRKGHLAQTQCSTLLCRDNKSHIARWASQYLIGAGKKKS